MYYLYLIFSPASYHPISRVIEQILPFLVELAQDLVAVFLHVSFLFDPRPDQFGEVACHLVILLGSNQIRQTLSRLDVLL